MVLCLSELQIGFNHAATKGMEVVPVRTSALCKCMAQSGRHEGTN